MGSTKCLHRYNARDRLALHKGASLLFDTAAEDPTQRDTGGQPRFYPVSTAKLIVLSLCTVGLYQLVWFYKTWKQEQERTGEDLSPFWRSVFAPLFASSLFTRVQEQATELALPSSYSSLALAVAYFALGAAWRLPEPYNLVALLAFLPLLPVRATVAAINAAKAAPQLPSYSLRFRDFVGVAGLWLFLFVGAIGVAAADKPSYARTFAEGCAEGAAVDASNEAGVRRMCDCMGEHVVAHNSSVTLMWTSMASVLNVETAMHAEMIGKANEACGQRHEKAFRATFLESLKSSCIENALSEGSPDDFARTRCECIARQFVGGKSAKELSAFNAASEDSEAVATRLAQAEAACDTH
jgi:hypothetical protein